MKFSFGNPSDRENVFVEAKNKEHAIKIFKVSELFPEKCVDKKFHLKYEYDNVLNRNIYTFKTDNPKISIYSNANVDSDWKKIGDISLKECLQVDFKDLIPQKNLLQAPIEIDQEIKETLPIVVDALSISQISNKSELREKHDEISRRKAELEEMVSKLNESMSILKDELKQKQKIIYIIETYLGIHEEVIQIADGNPAPENSLLSLYQQKLYMDEEIGIWDNNDGQGIDCEDISKFDEWISKHYKNFVSDPLSIVVWQIRRKNKEYGDMWLNVRMNGLNKVTYFLIRNGEKIYRIWSDVSIGNRLFPTKDEYIKFIEEERKWGEERAIKKLQEKHEDYLYGLIAIQGMIERTDILGTRFRQHGVNLLSIRGNVDEFIKFIRDAETEYWIGDGKPRWNDFLEKNRETICQGSRICLTTKKFHFDFSSKDNDKWRCSPFHPSNPPQRDHCYSVESFKDGITKEYFPHGTSILIRYLPEDVISWDPYSYEEIKRKRRVPFYLYSDEVINFDEISLEQADYYMKSRLDRENYIRMLPTLYWICRVKRHEQELENEFIKMIAGKLNWELTDSNKQKIQKQIVWWKLKNKWKRAITLKESTAIRMITKKLTNSIK
jgi:hypothetical protein